MAIQLSISSTIPEQTTDVLSLFENIEDVRHGDIPNILRMWKEEIITLRAEKAHYADLVEEHLNEKEELLSSNQLLQERIHSLEETNQQQQERILSLQETIQQQQEKIQDLDRIYETGYDSRIESVISNYSEIPPPTHRRTLANSDELYVIMNIVQTQYPDIPFNVIYKGNTFYFRIEHKISYGKHVYFDADDSLQSLNQSFKRKTQSQAQWFDRLTHPVFNEVLGKRFSLKKIMTNPNLYNRIIREFS